MFPVLRLSVALFVFFGGAVLPAAAQQESRGAGTAGQVRVISSDFVLPAKFEMLTRVARSSGTSLSGLYVETEPGSPAAWLADAHLVILDTPRPMDLAKVQGRIGGALSESKTPWIRVGGGPPTFGNLAPPHAYQLIGYYAHGGEANFRAMFAFLAALRAGGDLAAIPPPVPLPRAGIHHPDAPSVFASAEDYLTWGRERWKDDAARVAIVVHAGLLSSMETAVVDVMIRRSEAKGLLPVVFWFDGSDPQGLEKILAPARVDVLVNATHLQNGPARAVEFLKLDIPVIQALFYREGGREAWEQATTGISPHVVAPFLSLPESWGVSDPVVTDVVERGEPVPMPVQIDALLAKAARLAALRHKSDSEKRIALMFWNYPPGEKNFSAANLNVPRSLARLTQALAHTGYTVTPASEEKVIEAGQAMLAAVYDPKKLDDLYADGLADLLPLRRYREFWDALPEERRKELLSRRGSPDAHFAVREIDGKRHFIVPRFQVGNLTIMPQLPRSGRPHEHYHDTKELPDHFYLAAYVYAREQFGADALVHFGTHGTQEWTPGKDRGLSVGDYPYLAVGDLPVFYSYIQDNIAEALQAKRRGRAVIVSHQTPPFAPSGLYDELRDLHALIHEYEQLEDGAVREGTADRIRRSVTQSNLHRDLAWDEDAIKRDFPAFLDVLHDHLHELAADAMPLGLHTFGEPAAPEHRLTTVMQQLGQPFYRLLDSDPDEFFATEFSALQDSKPYVFLHRYLRDDVALNEISGDALREHAERAVKLDRHLSETGEIEALLAGLAGRFIAPGPGGDPIRNPDVPSGRNLYGFEADKVPTRAAFEAGGKALQQLIDTYRAGHEGQPPEKLAFSLWSGETMRHLGVLEAQVLHALGLRPVWNDAGRVTSLEIVPREELGRPRIDAVLQVTSVYRDQFDSFMRLLAEAIERLAALDEPDNPIARNSRFITEKLIAQGQTAERARSLSVLRLFSNEPGDYGSGLPDAVLNSASWEGESSLAESFMERMQFAYGKTEWGARIENGNLLSEQLRGVQAAVLSRSSRLHGILSTDHPFEYLGGLSLAIRHLDGKSPSLYISDLRDTTARLTTAAQFLASETRTRYFNPHWISGMKEEGYAGTLEVLNFVNNLWGWQVVDPATVRAEQWQAVHDTFVNDIRNLGLEAWFEGHNPTAQAQLLERLVEAIRKGYWDAAEQTRREIAERWMQLAAEQHVEVGAQVTREFVAFMAAGFGLMASAEVPVTAGEPAPAQPDPSAAASASTEVVRGAVLEPVSPPGATVENDWRLWLGLSLILACILAGAGLQMRSNAALAANGKVS